MALRDVQLSDDAPLILTEILSDKLAEKCRECSAAYERIEELEGGIKGLLGLLSLLSHNRDIPQSTRDDMLSNHRVIDAQEMLR